MKSLLLLLLAAALGAIAALSDPGAPSEGRKALRQLCLQARQEDPKAMYQLARLHETGYDSIAPDSLRAMDLYRRAAEASYPAAQNYYGFRLYNAGRHKEGLDWMEKAAMAGDPTASSNLGWIILNDKSVKRDYADAAFWFQRAADAGMPEAMSMLADLYRDGKGVKADTLKAVELLNGALEAGLLDASPKLLDLEWKKWEALPADEEVATGLYYYTRRVPTLGTMLFQLAAEKGSAQAHALLGDAMTRAQGASYDHDRALQYFYKGARLGNPSAQFILSELLEIFPDALEILPPEEAATLTPDYTSAQYWREKAAEAGVTDAAEANRRLLTPP